MACVASVRCGAIFAPAKLVSEKVVEAHGNHVVHASAPLVAPALRYTNVAALQPGILQPVVPKASLVAEKTIDGQHVVHNAQPALVALAKPLASVEQHVAIPAVAAREVAYVAPLYYPAYSHLVAEKTVSSYGHSVQHVA